MKSILISSLISLNIVSILICDENSEDLYEPPVPLVGIDSVANIFKYPEFLRKASYEGAFRIKFEIDSLGNTQLISFKPLFKENFSKLDIMIIEVTEPKLYLIKWKPAIYSGKNVSSFVDLPVIFILGNNPDGINRYYRGKWSYILNKEFIYPSKLIIAPKPIIVRSH